MSKKLILKSQENVVFKLLHSSGLNVVEFVWEEHHSTNTPFLEVSKLVHVPTGYYFIFDFYDDQHHCDYSPGGDKIVDDFYSEDWDTQINMFKEWISYLWREIESPDLWGTLQNEKRFIDAATDINTNELFSQDERAKIEVSLNEIKEFILVTHGTQMKNTQYLDNRIQYLIDSSKRIGRKDWIAILLGTLMSMIVSLSIPSESAGELLRLANTSLSWLINTSVKMMQ